MIKKSSQSVLSLCLFSLLTFAALPSAGQTEMSSELHTACAVGDLEGIRTLLNQGVDVNVRDDYGYTPLHYAVSVGGTMDAIELLIENKADVNIANNQGNTPLHFVVSGLEFYAEDAVQSLMDNGADAYARNKNGYTPLDIAKNTGQEQIVDILKGKRIKGGR